MPRAKISSVERRKAEVAGGVVLMVLRALPESGTAELLRELIDLTLVDAGDRAFVRFPRRWSDGQPSLPGSASDEAAADECSVSVVSQPISSPHDSAAVRPRREAAPNCPPEGRLDWRQSRSVQCPTRPLIRASAEGLRKTGQFEEALLEQMRSGDAG